MQTTQPYMVSSSANELSQDSSLVTGGFSCSPLLEVDSEDVQVASEPEGRASSMAAA